MKIAGFSGVARASALVRLTKLAIGVYLYQLVLIRRVDASLPVLAA